MEHNPLDPTGILEWLCNQHGYSLGDVQLLVSGDVDYLPPRRPEELNYTPFGVPVEKMGSKE